MYISTRLVLLSSSLSFWLANLKLEDVETATGAILIRHGKGNKQRIVRIGSKVQKALWRYVTIYRFGDSDALFLKRSGEPLDAVGFKILIRRLSNKASVKIYAHKLRHTFAISYLRNRGDAFTLQHLLRHATPQMTQRYLQSLSDEDAMAAHKRFSPLDSLKV